ncbi:MULTISPECIES: iron ABC transporter substrate-binding protein [unclassified Sinomonas]|uniref:Iron ABC transporter substrate-binding protein n=1 Tax=Sinomonas puerhi TaxID=3238584 RepID=A0AB39L4X8_9MICC
MPMSKLTTVKLVAAVTAATALAACSGPAATSSTASSGGGDAGTTITVYNAQHEQLTAAWADAFTKETGIKVLLRNGDDLEMGNQIIEEGKASPADVFLTENSPAMDQVENAHLLAKLDQGTLDQVPARYRPAAGDWTGIAARSTVLAYNKTKLSEAQIPASLMDLSGPAWKDRIGASTGGADFQAIVSAMDQLKGPDATLAWLKGIKDNARSFQDDTPVLAAVNKGDIEAGILYHYYSFVDQAQTGENSNNVALHYFRNQDPGAFVSVSGGAVLASSKHQEQAQKFIAFITSKAGQQVLADGKSFEYTVGSNVPSNPKLVPLTDLQSPAIDPGTLNSPEVEDLMTRAGLL